MPRKLRTPKQRNDTKAELDAWSMTFECGTDFFGETGLALPIVYGRRKINWPPSGPFVQQHMPHGFASARCS